MGRPDRAIKRPCRAGLYRQTSQGRLHSQPVSVAARSIELSAALIRPPASSLDWLHNIPYGAELRSFPATDPRAISTDLALNG